MVNYLVYDEDGDLMRIVGRKDEAEALCAIRAGWVWKAKREVKPAIHKQFEEAPF